MSKRITVALAILAGVGTTLGAATAAEATSANSRSVSVHYADLDLAGTAGQEALSDRIRRAARVACGRPRDHSFTERVATSRCREGAMTVATARAGALAQAASHRTELAAAAR